MKLELCFPSLDLLTDTEKMATDPSLAREKKSHLINTANNKIDTEMAATLICHSSVGGSDWLTVICQKKSGKREINAFSSWDFVFASIVGVCTSVPNGRMLANAVSVKAEFEISRCAWKPRRRPEACAKQDGNDLWSQSKKVRWKGINEQWPTSTSVPGASIAVDLRIKYCGWQDIRGKDTFGLGCLREWNWPNR